MIKVLAVCKSDQFIRNVEPYLNMNGIEITSVCRNSSIAVEQYKENPADVVLMDAKWDSDRYLVSGTTLIKNLKDYDPAARIITVTNFYEHREVVKYKTLGANGYFYRCMNEGLKFITACIGNVYKGNSSFIEE